MKTVLPGATIGILGGGQLGRMMAMAARSLGYQIQVMDPDPACPARYVVDNFLNGTWDNADIAGDLARNCDVVTLEIEQISQESLIAAEKFTPVRPSSEVLKVIQNRADQKAWLVKHNLSVGPYRTIFSVQDLEAAVAEMGPNIFLKSVHGGYDGRGQVRITDGSHTTLADAWQALGSKPCVAEQALDLAMEISIMVARSPQGEIRAYPSAHNYHHDQILLWSVLPSSLDAETEQAAQLIAIQTAEALHLEGLLAVELFVMKDGKLFINELAPRPHNSYHASERACKTSQFEQAIRAVCNLPLGEVDIVQPAAITNLLGDLWLEHDPHFDRALAVPEVYLYLYGKQQPRKGRKMGHLLATGKTPEEALERVLYAMQQL